MNDLQLKPADGAKKIIISRKENICDELIGTSEYRILTSCRYFYMVKDINIFAEILANLKSTDVLNEGDYKSSAPQHIFN